MSLKLFSFSKYGNFGIASITFSIFSMVKIQRWCSSPRCVALRCSSENFDGTATKPLRAIWGSCRTTTCNKWRASFFCKFFDSSMLAMGFQWIEDFFWQKKVNWLWLFFVAQLNIESSSSPTNIAPCLGIWQIFQQMRSNHQVKFPADFHQAQPAQLHQCFFPLSVVNRPKQPYHISQLVKQTNWAENQIIKSSRFQP